MGAIYIFKKLFTKKKSDARIEKKPSTQIETARLANRVVKITKLAAIYDIPLTDGGAAALAGLIEDIPDRDLEKIGAGGDTIIGCPVKMIPLLAGYSRNCVDCPYFSCDGIGKNGCVLKED